MREYDEYKEKMILDVLLNAVTTRRKCEDMRLVKISVKFNKVEKKCPPGSRTGFLKCSVCGSQNSFFLKFEA